MSDSDIPAALPNPVPAVAAPGSGSPAAQAQDRTGSPGAWVVRVAIGGVVLVLGLIAIGAWARTGVSRPAVRVLSEVGLNGLRGAHVLAWLLATFGLVVGAAMLLHRRRRSRPAGRLGRVVLLCGSLVVALFGAELIASVALHQWRRPSKLATRFLTPRDPKILRIAVVGESTAQGIPYDPWLSVGELVGWALRRVFPERRVEVRMLAKGGLCLEQALPFLNELTAPPDVILVIAGHNEFQARLGWSRSVRHYRDEQPLPVRLAWERLWERVSPLGALLVQAIDHQRIDAAPPPGAARELIDHPAFRPDEYQFIRDDFGRRLDEVCVYARQVGALPVLISPVGNEVDFAPSRSYLGSERTAAERAAFRQAYGEARARERAGRGDPLPGYRELAGRFPEFAELHWRIGRLLRTAGRSEEAREELRRARDLDGLPLRCPSDFLAFFPEVARRHDAVHVVGATAVARLSPDGLIDDELMHDPQHPNFAGYVALAQAVVDALAARRAFGWPADTSAPHISADAALALAGMTTERWAEVCEKTAILFTRLAETRYSPDEFLVKAVNLRRAARAIRSGAAPDDCGVPGIGTGATRRLLREAPLTPAG